MSSQLAASKNNQAALINKPVMQEHKDVVVEQIHPDKSDHQDRPEFQAAHKHEAFLQLLRERPAWMAEKYFSNMSDQTRQDFDESTDKTKRYWAQHPDLFLLRFGNSGSSSETSSGNQSTLPTQVSVDVAEDDGHGDYKTFIHTPRPRRKQRIAADLEKMIEQADSYDPISFDTYKAVHDAPERMERQPGNYETFQNQWQQRLYALWGRQQNYAQPGFAYEYPGEYIQWQQSQQLPPYQQCQPQPPPGYGQYWGNGPMYTHGYHARYQQQYMPQQPGFGYYGQFPVQWPAYAAHQRPRFNTYADEMMWMGLGR